MTEKRKVLDLKTKIDILDSINKGNSCVQLAEQYGVGTSTISDIKRQIDIIMKFATENDSCTSAYERKTTIKPSNQKLDKALYSLFLQKRKNEEPISDPILKEMAILIDKKNVRKLII